ncbi:MAG TPA: HAD-IA family hydrolase [Spirochaetota bacterium]|nr:HAD-IA family hydrolase [Spirochaetota bacterium]HPN82468.1 HAD-IA family hydrolase [Spirochaetota bacterium]
MESVTFNLVIFDLDGTLTDTSLDLAKAINLTRRELGLSALSVAEVVASVGNGAQRMVERTFADHPERIPEAVEIYHRVYAACQTESVRLYPGVTETLDALGQKNIPMGVITNKSQDSAREVLRHLRIEKFFALVLGDDGKRPLKPDPAPVYQILEALGREPEACLLVGDSWVDIECARNAGIRMAFLADRMGRAHQTLVPDFVMQDTREILTLFAD